MSLKKLCKATGLTLAIVGLSIVHSFASEEQAIEQTTEQTILENQLEKRVATHFLSAIQQTTQQEIERKDTP